MLFIILPQYSVLEDINSKKDAFQRVQLSEFIDYERNHQTNDVLTTNKRFYCHE